MSSQYSPWGLQWVKGFCITATLLLMAGCQCEQKGSVSKQQSPEGSGEGTTIRIGEVGSLTGSEATFGTSTHNGILLAFEEANASGGINGKLLELVTLDDQGKPDEAAAAITKLITQDQVVAVLGEVASSRSLAMAGIAQKHKVPMISPSSTNPKVTMMGDYIFRVCFIDPFQGEVMARFTLEQLKLKKVAILRDMKSDYSTGLAEFFREVFVAGGGEIVAEESYSSGDIDYKSQLTVLRGKEPEAIYVPGYYTEVGLIARQARELGLTQPLLGGDGWDSVKLTEIGGSAIDGSYFSNHYSPASPEPSVRTFVEKYKAKHNETPDGLAAQGYDAAGILIAALKRSQSTASEALRNALASTVDYPGVTGKITINPSRDADKPAVILKVGAGGEYEYLTTMAKK